MSTTRAKQHAMRAVRSFLLLLVAVAAVNLAAWQLGPSVDLTRSHRFSVSPATVDSLRGLGRTIRLEYTVSRERPVPQVDLRRDVVAKLTALAKAVGPEVISFDPATNVEEIQPGTDEGPLALRGLRPISTQTPTGTLRWFSNLRIELMGAREPAVLVIESPERLEYELVSQVMRLRLRPTPPPSPEAQLASIGSGLRIDYLLGAPANVSNPTGQAPDSMATLKSAAEALFARIKAANPAIEANFDNDLNSPARSGPTTGGGWSVFTLTWQGQRVSRIDNVTSMDGMLAVLARAAWELAQPTRRVGVLVPASGPGGRSELTPVESRWLYQRHSPEARLVWLLGMMGHDVAEVQITVGGGMPQDLAALVIPRPSGLSALERYELEAWLAGGGRALIFHGDWHLPLMDRALRVNRQADKLSNMFFPGDATGVAELRRVTDNLSGYLSSIGVQPAAGVLLAGQDSAVPARAVGPSRRTGEEVFAIPSLYSASAPLVPIAVPSAPLLRDVTGLPLRAGTPLVLKSETLDRHGLQHEVLLRTPSDAKMAVLDQSRQSYALRFSAPLNATSEDLLPPELNGGIAAPELLPAGDQPVAVRIRGQLPFDPSAQPPAEHLSPPGDRFVPRPADLVIVSSPDCLEYTDTTSADVYGLVGSGPLVGDELRSGEIALRRLIANVVDGFVYGAELTEVRQALLPPPRRVHPWPTQSRQFWLAANFLVAPGLAGVLWLILAMRRKARHRAVPSAS